MNYRGQITIEAIISVAVALTLIYLLLSAQTHMYMTIKEKDIDERFERLEWNNADVVISTYGDNRDVGVECKACVSYRRWFL